MCFLKLEDKLRRLLWMKTMQLIGSHQWEIELEEEQTEAKLESLLNESTLLISLHDINLFEGK